MEFLIISKMLTKPKTLLLSEMSGLLNEPVTDEYPDKK